MALLVFSFLIPLLFVTWLWRVAAGPPRLAWVASAVAATAVVAFVFVSAHWAFVGYPLRYLIVGLFLAALVASFRRKREGVVAEPKRGAFLIVALQVLLSFLFGPVTVTALRGWARPAGAVDVRFPLRDGMYVVSHGGGSDVINYHQRTVPQKYALDVVRLNAAGLRARGFFPRDVRKYAIWGREVIAPCAGTVVAVRDGLPDVRDEKQVEGNHVVIRCGDVDVHLAHLQRGSVGAVVGRAVRAGEVVGRVGSSGNATEPHLHVHAERSGVGVPLTFGGRWLVRNSVVMAR